MLAFIVRVVKLRKPDFLPAKEGRSAKSFQSLGSINTFADWNERFKQDLSEKDPRLATWLLLFLFYERKGAFTGN